MRWLKNLFVCLLLVFTLNSVYGSHELGTTISYRYIGDSTSTPNHYLFDVFVVFDTRPTVALPPPNYEVDICSSCYPHSTFTINMDTSTINSYFNLYDCGVIIGPSTPNIGVRRYRGDVVLPGTCADFNFGIELFSRSYGAANIKSPPGNGLLVLAHLNNLQARNSSAQFSNDMFRSICMQRQNLIHFTANKLDTDSVAYRLVHLKERIGTCGSDTIAYAPGYSALQPFAVDSLNPAVFNSINGLMSVIPINQGIYQVAVEIEDYRFDSIIYQWNKVGSSYCDIPIIVSVCDSSAYYGASIDTNAQNASFDTINNEWFQEAQCGDTSLTISYSTTIDVNTVAADGSDFWMLDPNKNPFPVMGASYGGALSDDKIMLDFAYPFTQNGRYVLRYKIGNDNNTVASVCGNFAVINDSIIVNVSGCSGVGVEENDLKNAFTVYPNPTKDFVKFSLNGTYKEFEYAIYNLQGKLVASGFSDGCYLGDLPSGTYLLVLKHNDISQLNRIVKQ